MMRVLFMWLLFVSLCGCTHTEEKRISSTETPTAEIALFSTSTPGQLPARWEPLVLFRTKPQTHYQLVADETGTVLHAFAEQASSGLMQHVQIDPSKQSHLSWNWKVGSIVETIDPKYHATEDSPARVILGFDGDKSELGFSDQILFETARLLTGYDFPYATLMYVWDKDAPVGTILTSRRSERIKMIVVANSASGVGKWCAFSRNIAEDFQTAFGEKPGPLIGVGVLTDTDNLGEKVEAWYGDIRLTADSQQAAK